MSSCLLLSMTFVANTAERQLGCTWLRKLWQAEQHAVCGAVSASEQGTQQSGEQLQSPEQLLAVQDDPKLLVSDLAGLKPTWLIGVPRVYDRLHMLLMSEVSCLHAPAAAAGCRQSAC